MKYTAQPGESARNNSITAKRFLQLNKSEYTITVHYKAYYQPLKCFLFDNNKRNEKECLLDLKQSVFSYLLDESEAKTAKHHARSCR